MDEVVTDVLIVVVADVDTVVVDVVVAVVDAVVVGVESEQSANVPSTYAVINPLMSGCVPFVQSSR